MLQTATAHLALYGIPLAASCLVYAAARLLGLGHQGAMLITFAGLAYFHLAGKRLHGAFFREEQLGTQVAASARLNFLKGLVRFFAASVGLVALALLLASALSWEARTTLLAAALVAVACHLLLPWVFVLPTDHHRRGRKLLTYDEATAVAEKNLPEGDPGVLWGGILHPAGELTQSHWLGVGVTRSGKTLTIRHFLQSVIPLVGLDPDDRPAAHRGTRYRAVCYDPKTEMMPILEPLVKCRVVLVNPFDLRGHAWRLRDDVGTDPTIALEVANSLIPRPEGEKNPFFTEGARALLAGIMISFALSGGEWNLLDVVIALRSRRKMREVLERHPQTRPLVEQYFEPEETFRNIFSTIANQMTLFDPVAHLWAAAEREGKSVSLKEWLEGDFVLVLGNDDSRRAVIDPLIRAVFGRIASLLLRPEKPAGERNLVILDELREAGHLPGLRRVLNKGLGEGTTVVAGFTDIAGLESADAYGEKEAREMLGMFSNKCVLRLESESTAEWAARIFGEYERYEYPVSQAEQGNKNTREELVKRESILPSQFLGIPPTGPERGLTGYYLSPAVGAYRATLPWSFVMGRLVPAASPETCPKFVKRDTPPYVADWDEDDFKRLRFKPFLVKDADRDAAQGGATIVDSGDASPGPGQKKSRLKVKRVK
jgi:hypothetical protein